MIMIQYIVKIRKKYFLEISKILKSLLSFWLITGFQVSISCYLFVYLNWFRKTTRIEKNCTIFFLFY